MAGGILARELVLEKFNVTIMDVDKLANSYDNGLTLPINIEKTYFSDEKPIGYGFGGTSNLWHGVVGDFDDSDWQNYRLETKMKEKLPKVFGRTAKKTFLLFWVA